MIRDPREQTPKPEIRNFPPPSSVEDEEDEEQAPWERFESVLAPLPDERAERVREQIEAAHEADARLETVTSTAYEVLAEATNHELRQIVTQLLHALQLGLRRTDTDERPITRSRAYEMIEALQEAGELLDAHRSREDLAKAFLDLSDAPFHVADAVRERLRERDLLDAVATDLDPAPARGDREHLSGAIVELVAYLEERSEDGGVALELSWQEDELEGIAATGASGVRAATLVDDLGNAPVLSGDGPDLPLARAVLEVHGGRVQVHRPSPGTVGFRFRLPALPPEAKPST